MNNSYKLELTSLWIKDENVIELVEYINETLIEEFIIGNIRISQVSLNQIMLAIQKLQSLKVLVIYSITIGQCVAQTIADIINANTIKTVMITNINNIDSMMEIVKVISNCDSIENLDLSRCKLDEQFIPWIVKGIESNYKLTRISMFGNNFGDSILEIAKVIADNRSINTLGFDCKNLSIEVADQFINHVSENYNLNCIHLPGFIKTNEIDKLIDRNIICNNEKHFHTTKGLYNL